MRFFITMLCILIIAVGSAFAETGDGNENKGVKKKYFYQWTDVNGVVHIADGLGKVPEQYREDARKIESAGVQETGGQQRREESFGTPDSGSEEAEAADKAEWQSRLAEWKNRLANAEKRFQVLDEERKELFRAWGSPALAPIENRQMAEQIDQQMREIQEEIDTARNMLDNVIPEEARKAGVPPGWLRE